MSIQELDLKNLAIIAKALSYLCITSTELKNKSIGEKADFLRSIGFNNKDVALLLNTSENSLRVLRSLNKKFKQKKLKS